MNFQEMDLSLTAKKGSDQTVLTQGMVSLNETIGEGMIQWFSLDVTNTTTTINVTVEWSTNSDLLHVFLFDENQQQVASDEPINATKASVAFNASFTGKFSVRVFASVVKSASKINYTISATFGLSKIQMYMKNDLILENHTKWYQFNVTNMGYPLEVSVWWDHGSNDLDVSVFQGITNVTDLASVVLNGNITSLIITTESLTVPTIFGLRIFGATLAALGIDFNVTVNYPIDSVATYTIKDVISRDATLFTTVNLDNASLPLEYNLYWDSASDRLNLTTEDSSINITMHDAWATLFWDGHAGLGSLLVKVVADLLVSGNSINFTIEVNYPVAQGSTFSEEITQGQSRWYVIDYDPSAGHDLEISLSWADAQDELEITLYDPYNNVIPYNLTKTPTSVYLNTSAVYWSVTLYLNVKGKTVSSQAVITYNGTASFPIAPLPLYTLHGSVSGSNSAMFTVEVTNTTSEQMLEISLFWNVNDGYLDIFLYSEWGNIIASDITSTSSPTYLVVKPFWDGNYTLKVVRRNASITTALSFTVDVNMLAYPISNDTIISGITPKKGGNGGTVEAMILGANLPSEGLTVKLTGSSTEIVGRDTTTITPNKVVTHFDLKGKPTGTYNVVVILPNGTSLTLPNAFTVEAGGNTSTWFTIVGRENLRQNTETNYYVQYGNSGEVDIYDVFMFIGVPDVMEMDFPRHPKAPPAAHNKSFYSVKDNNYTWTLFWIYKIGAHSSSTYRFTITMKNAEIGKDYDIKVIMIMPKENRFTETGDFQYLNESSNMFPLIWSYYLLASNATGSSPMLHATDNTMSEEEARQYVQDSMRDFKEAAMFAVGEYMWTTGLTMGWNPAGAFVAGVGLGLMLGVLYMGYKDGMRDYKKARAAAALDPNEKSGTGGTLHFVSPNQQYLYTIFFENLPNATIGAQIINITDQLSGHLDWSTLEITEITIGNQSLFMAPGMQNFKVKWGRPDLNSSVEIKVSLDLNSGLLKIDFVGRELYSDKLAYDGFLPPNVHPPSGEGHVTFTIYPKANLTSGTNITNQATIIFDQNNAIQTNLVYAVVDGDKPSSSVNATLGDTVIDDTSGAASKRTITLQVTGSDGSGSGIALYEIYYSMNNSEFSLLGVTNGTAYQFNGTFGTTYSFYSIAIDRVGNREDPPATPDATITVVEVPQNTTTTTTPTTTTTSTNTTGPSTTTTTTNVTSSSTTENSSAGTSTEQSQSSGITPATTTTPANFIWELITIISLAGVVVFRIRRKGNDL